MDEFFVISYLNYQTGRLNSGFFHLKHQNNFKYVFFPYSINYDSLKSFIKRYNVKKLYISSPHFGLFFNIFNLTKYFPETDFIFGGTFLLNIDANCENIRKIKNVKIYEYHIDLKDVFDIQDSINFKILKNYINLSEYKNDRKLQISLSDGNFCYYNKCNFCLYNQYNIKSSLKYDLDKIFQSICLEQNNYEYFLTSESINIKELKILKKYIKCFKKKNIIIRFQARLDRNIINLLKTFEDNNILEIIIGLETFSDIINNEVFNKMINFNSFLEILSIHSKFKHIFVNLINIEKSLQNPKILKEINYNLKNMISLIKDLKIENKVIFNIVKNLVMYPYNKDLICENFKKIQIHLIPNEKNLIENDYFLVKRYVDKISSFIFLNYIKTFLEKENIEVRIFE